MGVRRSDVCSERDAAVHVRFCIFRIFVERVVEKLLREHTIIQMLHGHVGKTVVRSGRSTLNALDRTEEWS